MEISIKLLENGRFVINKSDDMGNFMAIGMLELAKKIMLEPEEEDSDQIKGQVSLDEITDDMQ